MEIVEKHIGAYGIIIHDNNVALVKKARGGYKGKLDLPGGGIEHTENPAETLEREILEEAGIRVNNFSLLDATATNIKWEMKEDVWEDLHHIGILYVVEVDDLDLKQAADGLDSDGCNWYNINSLSKHELTPFAIYGLEKLGYKLDN